ncbi:MAG: protein-export membrane protein SecF [Rhizobiales bacterium 65-9]|nr:protein translocase subunit SecF [Hyphomicrobiales bacterium]OJY37691.1 MAG: protein-export membrane protein SecF [Rhizobiales bacterium 65-9]
MKLLRLVPDGMNFDFVRFRRVSFPFSAALSVLIVGLFLYHGLHLGIDFTGGTLVEVQAKTHKADVGALRQIVAGLDVGEAEVQEFGDQGGVSLRLPLQPGGDAAQNALVAKVRAGLEKDYDFQRVETVGPRVSGELVQYGTIGVVLSILSVMIYLWLRFEMNFAIGAIIGTMHDIVLTMGFFVITEIEFNMTSIAAILTIVGYSLNETVVVFDRTRELLRRYKTMPVEQLLNLSVNQTMSRTAMTATTALLSLGALVVFGGRTIEGFAIVMFTGVLICTYSAIFISSPALIYLGIRAKAGVAPEPDADAGQAKLVA